MNIKNRRYMESTEFKERQGSFGFFCARAAKFLAAFRDECRKGWRELFKRPEKPQTQLALDFVRNITEWANWKLEKNREIFA